MIISGLMILGGLVLMIAACGFFVVSAMPRYGQVKDNFTPRTALFISTPMFLAGAALLVLS